ncbi:hypothetical protein [Pseudomonas amygdali]|uniref:Uncharacterized protein n=2 Tax=Pseudomonas amygdali pv. lachrymans TaxID=53707 RepID=A0ABR5KU70_PSEAV|nr:hypothetical protein [Pseudomonas amygdali]AXH59747.1 hypothetical protein PLA107_031485 [Pseudomonas amygdali pv. lachrymans str. M301315]KPC17169.1 Uncharacterized protein AC499_0371 [Pseudomonas amygdali pv. lachrymans]KPC18128.1 Uncharacterized protein AC499_1330 [Pseudomonas amygdali pv. lachrymans]RMT05912.1 hypothetical protein ALP54_03649 [Pseudomonas amygdali pv. lachrymans]
MSKRFICVLALGVAAVAQQAMAHELAYSKSESVRVTVPGEANNWCKDSLTLSFERDSWTDSGPLDRLLPKIPYILGQECPKAKITWTATDKAGVVYADGSGNADNLGLINLRQVVAQAPAPVAASAAPTPEPAPVAAPPVVAPQIQNAEPAPVVADPPPVATPAAAPVVQAEAPAPTPEPAQQANLAAPALVSSDLGRGYLLSTGYFTQIKDQNGCNWLGDNVQMDGQADMYSVKSTGGSCVGGNALGVFKRGELNHVDGSNRASDYNFMILPSGLAFSSQMGESVKHLPVTFINDRKDKVVMEVGSVPGKDMKVYLAFNRGSNNNLFGEFSYSPSFVAITQDESFAFDDRQLLETLRAIHDTVRANYKGRLDGVYTYVAKDIKSLYPKRNEQSDSSQWILQTTMTERDGQMVTDLRRVDNYAVRRKQQLDRAAQQKLEQQYSLHSQLMERYNAAREQIGAGTTEVDYVAKMQGIATKLPGFDVLMNPAMAKTPYKVLVKVEDRKGDYYPVTLPGVARLYSEKDLEPGWYIMPVVSKSFVTPYEKGRAVVSLQGYPNTGACEQEKCAEVLSLARAVAADVGRWNNSLELINWSPEASQKVIDAYNAMKQQQATN